MKRIGNHVTKDGKKMDAAINDLIITAEANGIHSDCAQIFLIGPQSARENLSEDEKSGIKKIISRKFLETGQKKTSVLLLSLMVAEF